MIYLRKLWARRYCKWIEYWKDSKEWVCLTKWHRLDLWPEGTKYTCSGCYTDDCPLKEIRNV